MHTCTHTCTHPHHHLYSQANHSGSNSRRVSNKKRGVSSNLGLYIVYGMLWLEKCRLLLLNECTLPSVVWGIRISQLFDGRGGDLDYTGQKRRILSLNFCFFSRACGWTKTIVSEQPPGTAQYITLRRQQTWIWVPSGEPVLCFDLDSWVVIATGHHGTTIALCTPMWPRVDLVHSCSWYRLSDLWTDLWTVFIR